MKHRLTILLIAFFVTGLALFGFGKRDAAAGPVVEYGEDAFLKIDYKVQLRGVQRDLGSGPDGWDDTYDFYFRRNRLSFRGAANEKLGFVIQLEHNGGQQIGPLEVGPASSDGIGVLDAYLTYDVNDMLKLRVGKTKHIITREVLENCFDPLSADRSIFIQGPFAGKATRDYGVVAWGNLLGNYVQYRAALMEGNESATQPKSSFRYAGRVHVTLLDPESGFGYKGTYLGKKKVLTLGASYEMESDAVSDGLTATGSEDYTGYSYDLFAEYPVPGNMGAVTLSGAYYKADFNDAGVRGVPEATGVNGEKNGNYWKLGYMKGNVQVFGRIEDWSFADLNGVKDQNIKWLSGGINYYINGQDLRVTLEYSDTDFDKKPAADFRTLIVQVQAQF